jgi:hypothetical protein
LAIASLSAYLAGSAPGVSEPVSAADGGWRTLDLWDDGRAEFCAYEVEWFRYGTLFPGRALMILVKEPWAPDLEVKADRPRGDGFDVLKLNHLRDVPTGIYTYHQMASVFVRRDSGALRKMTATSSEGCGISTALIKDGMIETHSYFDGQGDREMRYPESALLEDGLAMTLRDFVVGAMPDELEVFPSLMAGRFTSLEPRSWKLVRSEPRVADTALGPVEAVAVRLERDGQWMSFTFAVEAPHRLLELRRSDGTAYRVAKCERIPYWEMNQPGGQEWLPESLR